MGSRRGETKVIRFSHFVLRKKTLLLKKKSNLIYVKLTVWENCGHKRALQQKRPKWQMFWNSFYHFSLSLSFSLSLYSHFSLVKAKNNLFFRIVIVIIECLEDFFCLPLPSRSSNLKLECLMSKCQKDYCTDVTLTNQILAFKNVSLRKKERKEEWKKREAFDD
jgi:hypothetical protein